jgi:hypothetical protein
MPDPIPAPLSRESLGHLAYLRRVLTQPPGQWDGFYTPQADAMNFGLRFQLAFASYAVAALGLHTPAYTRPYVEALGGALDRMLDVRAWGYWRPAPTPATGEARPGGHVAVLLAPHGRAAGPLPPPADPVVQDNVQFSGHLGTMLGLFERAGGDDRYDRGFRLADPASGVAYDYTHSGVAERIVSQMRANYFHGVACEPACAYVPCNNHAMTCNAIHDATHGTDYRAANADWLAWVRRKMVLRGPAGRGLFGACFLRDMGVATPVAFQFTDSWGLAFLLPFDRPLVRKLYSRFRKRLSRDKSAPGGVYVGSAPICEKMEISDVALNTAFGLIVARGLGDRAVAERMATYAATTFDRRWAGPECFYAGAPRTLHSTALYTLGGLVDGEGRLLESLFHAPRDPALDTGPCLDSVSMDAPGAPTDGARHIGVAEARYDAPARTLHLTTEWLGDAPPSAAPVLLTCLQVPAVAQVTCDGQPWAEWTHSADLQTLQIRAPAGARRQLTVQLAANGSGAT